MGKTLLSKCEITRYIIFQKFKPLNSAIFSELATLIYFIVRHLLLSFCPKFRVMRVVTSVVTQNAYLGRPIIRPMVNPNCRYLQNYLKTRQLSLSTMKKRAPYVFRFGVMINQEIYLVSGSKKGKFTYAWIRWSRCAGRKTYSTAFGCLDG